MGHFKEYFEGAKTFLTPKLSRAQRGAILGSKNNIPNFQKSAVHWYFYVPLRPEPVFVNVSGVQESIPKYFT